YPKPTSTGGRMAIGLPTLPTTQQPFMFNVKIEHTSSDSDLEVLAGRTPALRQRVPLTHAQAFTSTSAFPQAANPAPAPGPTLSSAPELPLYAKKILESQELILRNQRDISQSQQVVLARLEVIETKAIYSQPSSSASSSSTAPRSSTRRRKNSYRTPASSSSSRRYEGSSNLQDQVDRYVPYPSSSSYRPSPAPRSAQHDLYPSGSQTYGRHGNRLD
ncbi:hypothetical protein OC842_007011, partial [Tilletia horrida]